MILIDDHKFILILLWQADMHWLVYPNVFDLNRIDAEIKSGWIHPHRAITLIDDHKFILILLWQADIHWLYPILFDLNRIDAEIKSGWTHPHRAIILIDDHKFILILLWQADIHWLVYPNIFDLNRIDRILIHPHNFSLALKIDMRVVIENYCIRK